MYCMKSSKRHRSTCTTARVASGAAPAANSGQKANEVGAALDTLCEANVLGFRVDCSVCPVGANDEVEGQRAGECFAAVCGQGE